jgi:hypothetical protein
MSFPQLLKAATYLVRAEETAAVPDARKFSSDGLIGRELDSELTAEVENRILSFIKNHRADIGVLSPGERLPERQHASADPRPRFEDRNVVPGGLESVRGHKTGKPGSDNEYLHEAAPSA